MFQCILAWFKENSDAIVGLTSSLGIVIAIVGFWFTIYQLYQTQVALKATNTYAIQKDARDMAIDLMEDKIFLDYVVNNDPTKKYDQKTIEAAERRMRLVFSFYLSVFRQHQAKGISKAFGQSMAHDFSSFAAFDIVQKYYKTKLEAKVYDKEYSKMWDSWNSPKT